MIDIDRITELRSEIGPKDLSFIVSVYVDEARETLGRIGDGLSGDDLARAAHFLRSGALNIGLRGVANAAQQIEEGNCSATQAGQVQVALDQTVDDLRRCLDG